MKKRSAGRRLKSGLLATAILAATLPAIAHAQDESPLFAAEADMEAGQVHFTIPRPEAEGDESCYIYASSLRSGLGSPNIRLDRGMLGDEQLLCFRPIGGKVAAIFENPRFQATGDALTATGASESFPFSVAAMLPIVSDHGARGVTVDVTPLLVRDALDVSGALNSAGEDYRHSAELSGVDTASLKAFPRNVEVDVVQTFTASKAGDEIADLSTEPRALSFIVHHSFVALPEPGFVTRRFDPRAPVSGPVIYDFGAPLGQPVAVPLAARFRLEKTDPAAERSTVVEPIVFYIDPAAPEPVRTALMEGVNYWAPAFERAGFINAFRAEILPEGADPLDVRYNMVNWANRLTRGWSYGGGIRDPRTGEIIKGNVVLGALRVRQDIIIFEGLVGTANNNSGGPNDPVRAALDRIRQLAAHEVGHAIGFMHNFAGSTQDRTTVMDYPGPRLRLVDGEIDLSQAYAPGGGAWDDFSVDWLYADPAPGMDIEAHADAKALAIEEAGVAFVTDIDGRDPANPSPVASMWDDGPDPVAALEHMLAVREVALANFGEEALLPREPLANLRRMFVPIWLLHRYDVEATGKVIGGLDYEYKVAGDNHPLPAPFPAATQRAAIAAMLETLAEERLTVPDRLVPTLSVPITRLGDPQFDREVFQNAGAAAFDPLVAADVAAQITLDSLLAPERLTRLNEQHRRDPALPGADELVDGLITEVIAGRDGEVGRRVAWRAIMTMARTREAADTSPAIAALIDSRLRSLADSLAQGGEGADGDWATYVSGILEDRERLAALIESEREPPEIPPGMPIGGFGGWFDD
ncbi:zinc-dependent metalloprotease [Aurantiacibacter poecillastricola]|uniref:zinc-dependent metalloprotease n=1 Tax=Aurantiacibacter poecillastricola TaxID=3064385 RepID=UPI0027402557|nr:zinc-dependent metalloprotease [Aurantiacibacter sp. 219JJ12-13]MDP5262403.1 zinc-dependent metalloprotease [Aurantiacibacter sp. 219JJ12-13]